MFRRVSFRPRVLNIARIRQFVVNVLTFIRRPMFSQILSVLVRRTSRGLLKEL